MSVLFLLNWILGMVSLSNSVINFRSSIKYPVSPSIIGKSLQFSAVFILLTGKVLFISATLTTFPYLHPIAQGVRLVAFFFLFRYTNNRNTFHQNMELASAATITTACCRHKENTNSSTSWMFNVYAGVPFVVFTEVLSFGFYGILGCLVRNKTLAQLCKDAQICSFVEVEEIDSTKYGFVAWLYKLSFQQYNSFLLISWVIAILTCYVLLVCAYYKYGHPKKMIINENSRTLSSQ